MTYTRDPLSVHFDAQAAYVVGKAIAAAQRKKKNASVRGWYEVLVPNPAGVVPVRETRPDRLSEHERAFQRALYHNELIHQLTARQKPNAQPRLRALGAVALSLWIRFAAYRQVARLAPQVRKLNGFAARLAVNSNNSIVGKGLRLDDTSRWKPTS